MPRDARESRRLPIPREDTRQRLLEAAETLFASRGYRGTAVREIARAARCNVSMVAYYFGSKEGLLREVMRPRVLVLRGMIQRLRDAGPLDEQGLRSLVRTLMHQLLHNRPFIRLILSEALREGSPLGPEVMDPIWENQRAFRGVLEQAAREGAIRSDVDPGLLMTTLFGALVVPMLLPLLAQGALGHPWEEAMVEETADQVARLLARGILGPKEGR